MPTFLALQCYKCSMMQVKHDKKSSNKWSCSVCNEKQSVRKVFATSPAAKDIREFVQDYNLSRNIAQDRVLAELVEKADEGGDVGFMGADAPSFDIFGDDFSQHRIKPESKWTAYLSAEEKGLNAETSEDALDEARFVTTIPERTGRKPRGRVQAAAEDQSNLSPLQQPQNSSFMNGRSGKSLNKSIKSFRECHNDVQKENKSPHLWATKTSSGSTLRLQKTASMLCRQQLVGYMTHEVTVTDVFEQDSDGNGERVVVQAHVGSKTNVTPKIPEISQGKMERPISKWATYLESSEKVGDQRAYAISEQERHVSKWAKCMEFDEVKPRVDLTETSRPCAAWETFLAASEEGFPRPVRPQHSSSIWSLKAASSVQHLNGLARTELDELSDTSRFSEAEEEVHPLFS